MIEAVRGWITSIVTVTMLLSVIQTMVPDGRIRRISSFGGGLVLMVVLLQPIFRIDVSDLELGGTAYEEEIRTRQEEANQSVRTEWEGIIEREVAAYISDKADALGLNLSVEVRAETGDDGLPVLTAELAGCPSELLAEYLATELGIPRERQVWEYEKNN